MTPSRSGFVYLLALMVVLVTSSIAVVMATRTGLHVQAANDVTARAQCRAAALGVLRAVVNDFAQSQSQPTLTTVNPAGEIIGECTVMLLGRDALGSSLQFGVIAEGGKIDVNSAPIAVLALTPGFNDGIASAIADWRDVDDVPEENGGAERSDTSYHSAAVPYAPRNAPIEILDELRLVRGIDDTLWFGEDVNRNGLLDAGEDQNGDGHLYPSLSDLLTRDSREPALAPDGTARTNIRQANAMRARMSGLFGDERANDLFTKIQSTQPFANRLDLVAALELSDAEAAMLWSCISDGNRVGLIDAWSCREDILTAITSADAAMAIIAARPQLAPTGPGWLAKALGRAGAASYGASLSSGSFQFRLDIFAIRNDGAAWARLDASVDCSSGIPRVTMIRPMESCGWPFPETTLDQIRSATGDINVAAFIASGHR